jgi:hypothetical protein
MSASADIPRGRGVFSVGTGRLVRWRLTNKGKYLTLTGSRGNISKRTGGATRKTKQGETHARR